jgi:hypothetical protein
VVTAIKFSNDFKCFFSGDADGVLCHYTRNVEDVEEQVIQQSVLVPGPNQDKGLGKMMQQSRLGALENSGAKCFPFTLKVRFIGLIILAQIPRPLCGSISHRHKRDS